MNQIPISEEVLAESFMEATLELELEHKCYEHDVSIPNEELEKELIQSLTTEQHFLKKLPDSYPQLLEKVLLKNKNTQFYDS